MNNVGLPFAISLAILNVCGDDNNNTNTNNNYFFILKHSNITFDVGYRGNSRSFKAFG